MDARVCDELQDRVTMTLKEWAEIAPLQPTVPIATLLSGAEVSDALIELLAETGTLIIEASSAAQPAGEHARTRCTRRPQRLCLGP
ncbi:MAG TPA: hypothetical protein VGO31_02135 [Microbacteriaceae bacterium]|jgi:hypothetical protein|nr:hypothetical protein [Microbacteriaceae bacterium]